MRDEETLVVRIQLRSFASLRMTTFLAVEYGAMALNLNLHSQEWLFHKNKLEMAPEGGRYVVKKAA